jgi:hypothetical protein
LLKDTCEVTSSGRELEFQHRDRHFQMVMTVRGRGYGVSLGELQMRGCLVEPAVHEILRRMDQSKFGVVCAKPAWECL